MGTKQVLPDEQVNIKMSKCPNCLGIVTVAVKHMMGVKDTNTFLKEVMKFNLSVSEMPLLQYRENPP